MRRFVPMVFLLAACGGGDAAPRADLVLRGATVYTGEGDGAAQAIAVREGRIVWVGAEADAEAWIDAGTEVRDLTGRVIYPGFVDAHAHFGGIGQRELTLNLEGTDTKDAFLTRLEEAVARTPKGEWVTGRGWIETFWDPPVFPTRHDLDRIAPDHPVLLTRADGHASIANSAALRLAGVTGATPAPPGGAINLDVDGEPTGMLIDRAQALVRRHVPETSTAQLERAMELASERSVRLGWTQVHDMHGSWDEVAMMRRLYDQDRIKVRLYKTISGPGEQADSLIALGPQPPEFDDRFELRAIKIVVDGALGSRGAALLDPYSDDPATLGLITTDTVAVKAMLRAALRGGIQVAGHAIGDRANRLLLDLYGDALAAVPTAERAIAEPRWRNEHSQIVQPADLPRFAELGVIASMQPSHAIGDLHFVPSRIGLDRTAGAYAWHSLLELGVPVAGGSDAPVERGEPMIEFYAAVARKDLQGRDGPGWHPEERVTREQALAMFTRYPAFAAFAEDRAGTIAVGKRADFTILDRDIMVIPEPEILQATNVMTVIGGRIVYDATSGSP
ncbi:MAG: amidohydrolase [Gemmatimonadales bacterium]|nr:amidohydrolase [Gemmatimonadota bacterium]MCB9504553.1 amidohydrolase [Gemmatimonadales bacterium]MCB9518126.1 amidohydrolase [Gemmatimonadales bacterium]